MALARGAGATVWDVDGREHTDLLGGIATTILGHAHPRVVGAITRQAQLLGHVSNLALHEPGVALAERLLELQGGRGGCPSVTPVPRPTRPRSSCPG